MDISSLGSTYLEDYRLAAPSAGLTNAANGAQNFAEMLKKNAGDSQNSGSEKTASIDKNDKLYEQCLELETFMVKTLISSMRNTVQKSGLIDEGFAGKMYEDMLYDEYAKDFTRNANFGLAEQAYLELTGQRGKVLIRS